MLITYEPLEMKQEELEHIVSIYSISHSKCNYQVRERFEKHSSYPGYVGLRAICDEEIVGFAYGYTSLNDPFYYSHVAQLLSDDEKDRWLTNCFEFVELAVLPNYSGQGIASTLEKRLLDKSFHDTSIFITGVENVQARTLYTNLGWEPVKEGPLVDGEHMIIMGKQLQRTE
ncbi:GNAT family N-acetyltransferase [Pontibacillus yanchengensis]|uniref:GNAT family N-acetyltransferase n=2 Tax=Pontibacillus yanchengensis TaxID=462910 RepID=A0ACC7VE86_9BACI|nr:GNAT family N-acetyltransferase [Pontibacillus yanchengensis]MYL32421.1 GNAT family N-acetyltransferase [Pontibacillus yanchengensis]MYL53002.1 GNAT family N-acetyltransferase [Pontibacillus yanchengensis]